MQREVVRTAAALVIGNELLSGKTQDENLAPLTKTLRGLGVRLCRAVLIEDDLDTIANEVLALHRAYDVVFTSGGVGPTHDDVTIDAVARAFGTEVVIDAAFARLIEEAYGDKCTEAHLRMARVPKGSELITSAEISWPTVRFANVWVMPGVPEIFRMKLTMVRERLTGPVTFYSSSVFTRIEESELKPLLDQVVLSHPEVEVGSYPKWRDPVYKTKITLDATREEAKRAALELFLSLLPAGEPEHIE